MRGNILLVEDDPVWSSMLADFINREPDLCVVHVVDSKEGAILYCTQHEVDVVLMDLNLTDHHLDGIQAILELNLLEINAKVVALTSLTEEKVILDTFTAGAIQYVKKSDFRNIPNVIRGVLTTISPQEVLVKEFTRMKEAEQYNRLTPAEKEIIYLLKDGHKHAYIQKRLVKAESTLKNQITRVLRKYGAKNVKEVISIIKNRGLKF